MDGWPYLALVCEDEPVLRECLKRWHLEYEVTLDPDGEKCSSAWVIYHSSKTCPSLEWGST